MPQTFEQCWRKVLLHAPMAGAGLARDWTQWAYNQFCDRRGWSHLRAITTISVTAQKSGTATVATGSATVTAGTLTFLSTDVGRQFRISTVPIYTIIAVSGGNATLDRAYTESSGTFTFQVLDAYVTMPADFQQFIAVIDPQNRWRLKFWISQDRLNTWDPVRQNTGNAYWLANQAYSPVPGFEACPRYELYPYQTGDRTYPVFYYRKPETLADDTQIIGPLSQRASEILLHGALHQCSMWPGPEGKKNPYFDLRLAQMHGDLFEQKLIEVAVKDEDLYFEAMPLSEYPFAPEFPFDSAWLQSHEPYTIG